MIAGNSCRGTALCARYLSFHTGYLMGLRAKHSLCVLLQCIKRLLRVQVFRSVASGQPRMVRNVKSMTR